LAATKHWRRQYTHVDKIIGVNKILASTKCWRRQNISVHKKMSQTQKNPLTVWPSESTTADLSQTSLKISYVSLMVLLSLHAVIKCGVASRHPAFMGGVSPVLNRLIVPACHAENVTNFGADKISAST
jgi:hypothetical protein